MSKPFMRPPRQSRKLNTTAIKSTIMTGLGLPYGAVAAFTGISPQTISHATLGFMLGLTPERTQGTALLFTLFTGLGSLAGLLQAAQAPRGLSILSLFVGALVAAWFTRTKPEVKTQVQLARIGQVLTILLSILVIGSAMRGRVGGPLTFPVEFLVQHPDGGAFLIGIVSGLAGGLLQIGPGVVIVAALVYLADYSFVRAAGLAIGVTTLSAILPLSAYSAKGVVDKGAGRWMAIGGGVGGFFGAMVLTHLSTSAGLPFVVFGLFAMFLAGWTLSRM